MNSLGLCFVWLSVLAAEPKMNEPPVLAVKHVDVFRAGESGYFAYRIPAIETAADGSLVAFAEARKYNLGDPGFGKQDIDLVLKRSEDRSIRVEEVPRTFRGPI